MKQENHEALEAYKIRIDALEIINEAYLAKIEALELLNNNLQFLREARNQVQGRVPVSYAGKQNVSGPVAPGEKRGRGRPRKFPVQQAVPSTHAGTATNGTALEAYTGVKRGRGRPRKFPVQAAGVKTHGAVTATGEKRGRGRPRKIESSAPASAPVFAAEPKKRGPKPKNSNITRLQVPLEAWLKDTLKDDGFNKATFRALTGILLCLFENGTATVSNLNEYIGGSRVTVVRHTAFLKKLKLLTYEGSRKKGHYALTAQGKALYERLANA
jgi:hypothetical protein